MKALVTGANGFTGSHLVKRLQDHGHTIVGLVRKTSNLARLADYTGPLVYGDITDHEALQTAMAGVDVVFHTAAYVDLGIVDAAEMARVNVSGTQAVVDMAQALGVPKLVYCSTIGVYGDTQGAVIDETFQRQQTGFSSPYDATKYQAQQVVDQAAAAGFHGVSVMPSGIFGPDDPHFGPVIRLFLKGRLKVWPGGDRLTGIVHVDDLADAMLLAAETGGKGEHYIISAGELKTRDMFAYLAQITGQPAPADLPEWLVRLVGNALEPIGRLTSWNAPLNRERVHYIYDRCVRVDASKARHTLGWQPRSVVETLRASLPPEVMVSG